MDWGLPSSAGFVPGFVGEGFGGPRPGQLARHAARVRCLGDDAPRGPAEIVSDGWDTEARLLKKYRVEHRFFPYLKTGGKEPPDATIEAPQRRLFLASGSGSGAIARVENGELVRQDGKTLKEADALWTTENGVGLGALKRPFNEDRGRIGVPVLIASKDSSVISASSVDLLSIAAGMVEKLLKCMSVADEVSTSEMVAAVGSDQRFSAPMVVNSALINKLFLDWEDTLPRGSKRRVYFVHERQGGDTRTSVVAKSKKRSKGPVVKLAVRLPRPQGNDLWFINLQEVVAERLRQRGIDHVDVLSSENTFRPSTDTNSDLLRLKAEGMRDASEESQAPEQLAAIIAM